MINLDWKQGSQSVLVEPRRERRVRRRRLRQEPQPDGRLAVRRSSRPTGDKIDVKVQGIFKPPTGGSPFGPVTISSATFDRNYEQPKNLYTFVTMNGGVTDANTAALEASLKTFPNAKVADGEQFKDNQISGLKSVLNVLYVLLALSILVSLFGIVNTLVLTVFERTREIGMLRAIGMTRRQTRRMIRHESVITSLIGAVIGIVLGVVLGGAPDLAVKEINFFMPWTQIVIFIDRGDLRRHRRGDLPGAPRREARPARGAPVRVAAGRGCRLTPSRAQRAAPAASALARDAVPLGRLGDRRGDGERHVAVEDARDHVLGPELVVGDHRGDRMPGRDLHPLRDRARADVERAAEDAREREHVVDLVRVVGAAGRDDRDLARRQVLGRDLGRRVGHREDDRVVGHPLDPGPRDRARQREAEEDVGAGEHLVGACPAGARGSCAPRTPA